jgi:hypothetical protein
MLHVRPAAGTAVRYLVFSRFHDLMHGAARVADACVRLPIAPAGGIHAERHPQSARPQRTAVRPRSQPIERASP